MKRFITAFLLFTALGPDRPNAAHASGSDQHFVHTCEQLRQDAANLGDAERGRGGGAAEEEHVFEKEN